MTTAVKPGSVAKRGARVRVSGLVLLVMGLATYALFAPGVGGDVETKFGLNPGFGSQAIKIPDLVLPTAAGVSVLAAVAVLVGAWQLARGFRSFGAALGIVSFCFVVAFLLWAARGKSFSLVGMLSSSVVHATPIALAALCGVVSERAGVTNIAIEGIMLTSALTSVVAATIAGSLVVGLLVAILTGMALSGIHAFLAIKFRVDQIVSGVAINIFATGLTSFISSRFLERNTNALNNSGTFSVISLPLLSKIPIIGPVFFENTIIVYLMFLLVIAINVLLFATPWGLRSRAVGEHPKAADTLGVNVYLVRYVNVILGGAIAGIGGAYFTIGSVGRFDEVMTAGKGFIGLAAMIFGKWTPVGAFFSSLLFGFADSLQVKLQILRVPIPSEFLLMAPYIVTMVVLAGVVGRALAPAADGQPYEK